MGNFSNFLLKYRENLEKFEKNPLPFPFFSRKKADFTSIIGGAGVTSGEKQLTSGSGVAIY